jgi:hypothetical protein
MRFKLLNRFTEGGVGHIQGVCGPGKAVGFDNARKNFKG